jgi:iron-sulfur cluster assembly protein
MPSVQETPATEAPAPTRPNPVRLTDRAAAEVRRIAANKQIGAEYALRVGVKGGGCSGMSYILGYDTRREHDLEFEENGVAVVMDRRQGLYLMGAVVDYHDGLDARGFVFDNPNATTTCGCGSSFAA